MEIQQSHNEHGGIFYIDEPDEAVTELVYQTDGANKMIIEHTEVSERQEGKGIGKKLVAEAIEYARQHGMKVLPMCAFAKTIMERSDDYKDVLAGYGD